MLPRAFAVAVLLLVLGLAALELRVLWPLAGASVHEYELREIGHVELAAEGKEVRIRGLSVSPSGVVWAADGGGPPFRTLALDADGALVQEFPGYLGPGLSTDGEDVLIIDPQTATAYRIGRDPASTSEIRIATGLSSPSGIARYQDGYAIANTSVGNVVLIDDAGEEAGALPGNLLEPRYVLIDDVGRVYANDQRGRVVRWTDGRVDAEYRTRDRLAAVLSNPKQFAIDGAGRLWVADDAARRVWAFDVETTELLGSWKPPLAHPSALAIHDERIYIAEGLAIYWFTLPE